MAVKVYNFDVNHFKSKTIKASIFDYKINFENDTTNQIKVKASGNNLILTVYKASNGILTSKVLGKITIKNANKSESIILSGSNFESTNLLDMVFEPVKKKNKYIGTSFNEIESSTSSNEIFSLRAGTDTINYNMTYKQGKDTINLSKNEKLNININNANDKLHYSYLKSGNNLILKVEDYLENQYTIKAVCKASKIKNGYSTGNIKLYQYNPENLKYEYYDTVKFYATKSQLGEFGLKAGKTATLYCKLSTSLENLMDMGEIYNMADYIESYTKKAPNIIDSHANITIKNYFKYYNNCNISIAGLGMDNLTESFKSGSMYFTYDYSEKYAKKITGSVLSDYIITNKKTKLVKAGEGNNVIEFSENQSTVIDAEAGTGNDEYYVNTSYTSHYILDKGGNDTLIINNNYDEYNKTDLLFLFDVRKNGVKASDWNTLYIVPKNNYDYDDENEIASIANFIKKERYLRTNVEIDRYFNTDGTIGDGCIENIGTTIGENEIYWDLSKINTVRQNVAAWLNETTYKSALHVIQKGSANEITQLLQIYDTITKNN